MTMWDDPRRVLGWDPLLYLVTLDERISAWSCNIIQMLAVTRSTSSKFIPPTLGSSPQPTRYL
ncbi:MAG: hypothetical protein DDT36_01282 [Firmicutes bacterium]|nr:hypothetical protein [Bacillota bacterium]